MRTPTTARRIRTLSSSATMCVALLGLPACATLRATVGAYETGPNGITRPQQRLREALVRADFTTALAWSEDDALLRALNVGVSSYYASQFARSAAMLDSAALLADDRITISVSKNALALVTNDLARDYQPRRTERLFIPYYGMLAFSRLEQWEDAAVEARRLTALLEEYATDRSDAERSTHATLHYLAAKVFERAGERNEAQVAYRNARALLPAIDDSASGGRTNGDGEVLVVVERGFVAHRATSSINVFFHDSDRDSVRGGSQHPRDHEYVRHDDHDDDDEDGYWLSVALPSVRRSHRSAGEPTIIVDGASAMTSRISALLDDAVAADEQRERVSLLARATARAAAKYVITKAVKDKKGEVAGSIANIGASLLERADIRSWHLLPQEISLLRVRVPAGQHGLEVAIGAEPARVDVGTVSVRAGQTTIAAVRLWNESSPPRIAIK
ncbi:MAG: hypothetical protein ABI664_20085 [bacterium]